ncbi:MAG: extracellular solute-binding protein [Victivallaceae bacterium]|nr:extracellular solute-binding protein [Victivallaceae bacterium]
MKKEYMPLYIRVKSDIINRIASGKLKKGDRLPSERELAEEFGVSRITVVGALRELAEEGVIRKRRGNGSFIDIESLAEDYDDIFSHITGKAAVEITFGILNHSPQYEQMMKTLAGLFQLENPGIKVKVINLFPAADPNNDIYLIKIGSGEVPTVGEFFFHADYAAIDALMPLENMPGFRELAESLRPQCIYETADAGGTRHVHALVSKTNTCVVLVNSTLLREAGIEPDIEIPDWGTLEAWTEIMGDFTGKHKPGYYGIFPEIPIGWHGIVGNLPYLWADTRNFSNSIAGFIEVLQNQNCVKGLDFLARLFAKGNPYTGTNGLDIFAVGHCGILLSGTSWILTLRRLLADKFDMKAFPIPWPDKNTRISSVLGNYCFGIFRSAVNSDLELDAAWKWIKFLFRKKQQFAITADFTLPALKNTPCLLTQYENEICPVLIEAESSSIPQFDFKDLRTVYKIFGSEMKSRLYGKISSEQCVADTITQIKRLHLV